MGTSSARVELLLQWEGKQTVSGQSVYSASDDKNCMQEAKHWAQEEQGWREQMLMSGIQE